MERQNKRSSQVLMRFLSVDCGDQSSTALCKHYRIVSYPTVLVFDQRSTVVDSKKLFTFQTNSPLLNMTALAITMVKPSELNITTSFDNQMLETSTNTNNNNTNTNTTTNNNSNNTNTTNDDNQHQESTPITIKQIARYAIKLLTDYHLRTI